MAYRPLVPTKAPRMPASGDDYQKRYFDELLRVFSLYFAQIDNALFGLLGRLGGQYISSPSGAFSNSATQTITAANTPYVVALNTTDQSNGMSLASNQITVDQGGIYNLQFSLQFENTVTSIVDTWVWIRKNGTDLAGTASTWAITSSHGGTNGYVIGACNFFVDLNAGDYVELVVAANGTGINLEAYSSSVSPFTRPSIPSSVVTLAFVSSQAK